ncbi:hypothetical protein MB14_01620 [Roseivirga ehrenbergii]|uniref:DUF7477 domain-containing protein n=2 Tax=Roseivirga ehrenbergii (strain DSM 102268 / JCM 13514 / KCTC 12282 / NCIMB 14502 / KMM 6017) TaxID=279360 RepID=A0A150XTQ3_ROSEK|nr:hypothetical protein MB14_01620 [Roseivirga ehrenbergii]
MTYGSNITAQKWKTRTEFPKEEISDDWDNDYYLSSLSYNNNLWTVISSKTSDYSLQSWRTRVDFPKDEITELWDAGYAITELTYGNDVWALVMSKGSSYSGQKWSTTTEFPKDKIKEYWDEGRSIIKLAYGQGKWAIVGSKTNKISLQKWRTSETFPIEEIEENLALGYSITQLEYLNDLWVLVLSKYTDNRSQELITSESFPKEEIRKYWDSQYYITNVGYQEIKQEEIVEPEPESITETTKAYSAPENSTDPRITGVWNGTSLGDTEEVEITFEDNNVIIIISGDDVMGGENFEIEDIPAGLNYELNTDVIPHQIDIIFTMFSVEFSRIKGIFEFSGKNEIMMLLSDDPEADRPKGFTSKPGTETFKLTKTSSK